MQSHLPLLILALLLVVTAEHQLLVSNNQNANTQFKKIGDAVYYATDKLLYNYNSNLFQHNAAATQQREIFINIMIEPGIYKDELFPIQIYLQRLFSAKSRQHLAGRDVILQLKGNGDYAEDTVILYTNNQRPEAVSIHHMLEIVSHPLLNCSVVVENLTFKPANFSFDPLSGYTVVDQTITATESLDAKKHAAAIITPIISLDCLNLTDSHISEEKPEEHPHSDLTSETQSSITLRHVVLDGVLTSIHSCPYTSLYRLAKRKTFAVIEDAKIFNSQNYGISLNTQVSSLVTALPTPILRTHDTAEEALLEEKYLSQHAWRIAITNNQIYNSKLSNIIIANSRLQRTSKDTVLSDKRCNPLVIELHGNWISGSSEAGIWTTTSGRCGSRLDVSNNFVFRNNKFGIAVKSSNIDISISNNTISTNNKTGIFLYQGGVVDSLHSNHVINNTENGIEICRDCDLCSSLSTEKCTLNVIENNKKHGINLFPTKLVKEHLKSFNSKNSKHNGVQNP